jgi:hypothetical protein
MQDARRAEPTSTAEYIPPVSLQSPREGLPGQGQAQSPQNVNQAQTVSPAQNTNNNVNNNSVTNNQDEFGDVELENAASKAKVAEPQETFDDQL